MTKEEAIAKFVAGVESKYRCVDGLWMARCQTGDVYVNLGATVEHHPEHAPGTLRDGLMRELALDVETAYWQLQHCFEGYERSWLEQHPGETPTLYWRYVAPHVALQEIGRGKRYRCYLRCRLVLSAQPVIYPTADDVPTALKGTIHGEAEQRP